MSLPVRRSGAPIRSRAAAALLMLLIAGGLAACATTPEERGPFHEYLHEHGLE